MAPGKKLGSDQSLLDQLGERVGCLNSIMADNMLIDTTQNMFYSIVEEDIGLFLVNITDMNTHLRHCRLTSSMSRLLRIDR